jgi:hypothetical protein
VAQISPRTKNVTVHTPSKLDEAGAQVSLRSIVKISGLAQLQTFECRARKFWRSARLWVNWAIHARRI